jgi:hypothetical protein
VCGLESVLQQTIDNAPDVSEKDTKDSLEMVVSRINSFRNQMDRTSQSVDKRILDLKQSSSTFGANYHWIVFVLLYGGVFFLQ